MDMERGKRDKGKRERVGEGLGARERVIRERGRRWERERADEGKGRERQGVSERVNDKKRGNEREKRAIISF